MFIPNWNVMPTPRRYLPSINLLIAFEAVARNESVSSAADELSLTQSAISRQLQKLERQLDIQLFTRTKKRLKLSMAGADYVREIRKALQQISQASLQLKVNPEGGVLNLGVLPTFGARWLAPRMGEFLDANPGISLNLNTRLAPFDFDLENLDAAVHYGMPDWPGAEHTLLMNEMVIPACSQEFAHHNSIDAPADMLRLPLLHLQTRPNAWAQWMETHGVFERPVSGMVFDQFATMSQAAIYGVGIALLPPFLIERELSDGRLIPAFGKPTSSSGNYYFVWPRKNASYGPVIRFRDWISQAAHQHAASG